MQSLLAGSSSSFLSGSDSPFRQWHSLPAVAASRWLSATVPLASKNFPMAIRHGAAILFAMALPAAALPRRPWPAAPLRRPGQQLRHGALASNKPHPAEKSTPVWLAIWRTWAGFANSQLRHATFATPDNICAHSSLLQH